MLTIAVWWTRILHQLRDVELAVQQTARHDPSVGIHEVAERVAILRALIEKAVTETTK
jgi:hypothetical protein